VPKPKLVINLVCSWGFKEFTSCCPSWGEGGGYYASMLGFLHGKAGFGSREDERDALDKIDRFMADVLIPLAAQTNAIVVCEAVREACVLSTSLRRMLALGRSKAGCCDLNPGLTALNRA